MPIRDIRPPWIRPSWNGVDEHRVYSLTSEFDARPSKTVDPPSTRVIGHGTSEINSVSIVRFKNSSKLGHIRGAVAHHVYEEEDTWFLKLQRRASPETMERLTRRFKEEFDRYMGDDDCESVISAKAVAAGR